MNLLNPKVIRLFSVAGIAAIGHLLSVFLIPYSAKEFGSDVASKIAIIDSTVILISSILAFGLSLTVTRDVLMSIRWQERIQQCIDARFSLAVLLIIVAGGFNFTGIISDLSFFCFLAAPIIAFNLDFVLYGRDMPVSAACASFIRLSIPVIIFAGVPFFWGYSVDYLVVTVVCYISSAAFVFKQLGVFPRLNPDIKTIRLYQPVILIGFGSLCIVFQRLGFLTFFDGDSESTFMLSSMLKFYLAFVAIRRLFIQTFYASLLDESIYKNIEIFCFFVAVAVGTACILYSANIAGIVLGESNETSNDFVFYFGFLIISGSFFSTADARLFLKNQDRRYYLAAFVSTAVWVFGVAVVYSFNFGSQYILMSLAAAEFVLALTYKYYLQCRI